MSRDLDMEIVEYLKKMKEGGISSAAISEENHSGSMQISPLFHIGTRMEGILIIWAIRRILELSSEAWRQR